MTLKQILQTTSEIWIVLDSGAKEEYGYFGYVIATSTKIIWKGNGQACGNPQQMESQRAECIGCLAGLTFLVRYIEYHEITPKTELLLYFCDNKTVVNRVQWNQGKTINNPNEYLAPNYDVQMAINDKLEKLIIQYKCDHSE